VASPPDQEWYARWREEEGCEGQEGTEIGKFFQVGVVSPFGAGHSASHVAVVGPLAGYEHDSLLLFVLQFECKSVIGFDELPGWRQGKPKHGRVLFVGTDALGAAFFEIFGDAFVEFSGKDSLSFIVACDNKMSAAT
jgi:hypothetical protein